MGENKKEEKVQNKEQIFQGLRKTCEQFLIVQIAWDRGSLIKLLHWCYIWF